jgi:HJR/Mrr/RecB family endonuclease
MDIGVISQRNNEISKISILVCLLIISLSIVSAEEKTVFDRTITVGENISINNLLFRTAIDVSGETFVLNSDIFSIYVKNGTCDDKYNYEVCYVFSPSEFRSDPDKAQIKIIYDDCKKNYKLSSEYVCKTSVGDTCFTNEECITDKCVHNLCLERTPFCGDGYCDNREENICAKDCSDSSIVVSTIPYAVKVDTTKTWSSTNYEVTTDKDYVLSINKTNVLEGHYEFSINKLCSHVEKGEIVAKIGIDGTCFKLEENDKQRFEKSGTLYVALNDNIYLDNSGEFYLSINEYKKTVAKEKVRIDAIFSDTELGSKVYYLFDNDISTYWNNNQKETSEIILIFEKPIYIESFLFSFREVPDKISVYFDDGEEYKIFKDLDLSCENIDCKEDITLNKKTAIVGFKFYGMTEHKKGQQYFWKSIRELDIVSEFDYEYKYWSSLEDYKKEYGIVDKEPEPVQPKPAPTNTQTTQPKITNSTKSNNSSFNWTILLFIVSLALYIFHYRKKNYEELDNSQLYFYNYLYAFFGVSPAFINKKLTSIIQIIISWIMLFSGASIFMFLLVNGIFHYIIYQSIKKEDEKEEEENINRYHKAKNKYEEAKVELDTYEKTVNKTIQEINSKKSHLQQDKQKYDSLKKKLENEHREESKKKEEELKKLRQKYQTTKKEIDDEVLKEDKKTDQLKEYKKFISKYNLNEKVPVPEFVKKYYEVFGEDKSQLNYLAKHICNVLNTPNEDFMIKTVKELHIEIINSNRHIVVDLSEVDLMSGSEFEDFVCELLEKIGYTVKNHKKSRDGGVDITAFMDNKKTIIQAKKYNITNSVGVDAVRDVVANKETRNAHEMVVVTTSSKFSSDALVTAKKNGVHLWDRAKLKELMKKAKMLKNGKN